MSSIGCRGLLRRLHRRHPGGRGLGRRHRRRTLSRLCSCGLAAAEPRLAVGPNGHPRFPWSSPRAIGDGRPRHRGSFPRGRPSRPFLSRRTGRPRVRLWPSPPREVVEIVHGRRGQQHTLRTSSSPHSPWWVLADTQAQEVTRQRCQLYEVFFWGGGTASTAARVVRVQLQEVTNPPGIRLRHGSRGANRRRGLPTRFHRGHPILERHVGIASHKRRRPNARPKMVRLQPRPHKKLHIQEAWHGCDAASAMQC